MKDILYDYKNYYFFRSLNDEHKKDYENGIYDLISDSTRYFNENGKFGKYNKNDKLTLEELYDHVGKLYRRDTNCISITNDANVCLTYHEENPIYVVIKIPEDKMKNVIDARKFFFDNIKEKILKADKEIKLDNYEEYDDTIISKMADIIKKLEKEGKIGNLIKDVLNKDLLDAMENAYKSSEFIYYGDISKDMIINIPKDDIKKIALLQNEAQKIENIISKQIPIGRILTIISKL